MTKAQVTLRSAADIAALTEAGVEIGLAEKALQRACLLFTLIEDAAGRGDLNSVTLLAQIGSENSASAGDIALRTVNNLAEVNHG